MIRQWCDVEISLRSGANNEFLVEVTATLLGQVATRAKAELSVERVDETKSEGDNSAWRPLLRPRDLDTFLRVTRGGQTMVLEVSVASGEGVVCGLKHEVSHPVHVVLRTLTISVVRLLLLGLRRRPHARRCSSLIHR